MVSSKGLLREETLVERYDDCYDAFYVYFVSQNSILSLFAMQMWKRLLEGMGFPETVK